LLPEEASLVTPEIINYDEQNKPVSIHYDSLVVALLKAVQNLEKVVADQELRFKKLSKNKSSI
jgi:hypothetical protein